VADYLFSVPLYTAVGTNLKLARNARASVLDPVTGLTAADLTQNGQPVAYVTADASGTAEFTSSLRMVRLVTHVGNTTYAWVAISPDAYAEALAAIPLAQDAADAASASASDAAASASSAAAAAALVGAPAASAIDAYIGSGSSVAVRKSDLPVNVKDRGVKGDGTTDDTAAIQAVLSDATVNNVYFPPGTYLADGLTVTGKTGFRLDMAGRLKRRNGSPRWSILAFVNCTDVQIGRLRTDGSVATNGFSYSGTVFPVDEAKHDVRVDNCVGFHADFIDSLNPAGDTFYLAGGSSNNSSDIQIGVIRSKSDGHTGRNACSIIKGASIQIGRVQSIKTGFQGNTSPAVIAMPSGFDIEPNSASDVVTDVQVDLIQVTSAGGSGCAIYSNFGKVITNVQIGAVSVTKETDVRAGSGAVTIKGVQNLRIGTVRHQGVGVSTGMTIEDADEVSIDAHLRNCGGNALTLGVGGAVSNFKLTGSIWGAVNHLVVIYSADKGSIDMTLKNPGNGFAVLNKIGTGTSSDLQLRGNWAKDTTGSQLVVCSVPSGTVGITNWVLEGVDATGWGIDTRFKGVGNTSLQNIAKRHVLGVNFGTAPPNFDTWRQGDIIWNSSPVAGGVPGWVCVASGTPGTWKAMPTVAA
jgi:hypothetical protein